MDIDIHGTKSIILDNVVRYVVEKTGRVFYTRKITVDSEEGPMELTLYSDDKTTLSL